MCNWSTVDNRADKNTGVPILSLFISPKATENCRKHVQRQDYLAVMPGNEIIVRIDVLLSLGVPQISGILCFKEILNREKVAVAW